MLCDAADYERATGLVTKYSENWFSAAKLARLLMWTERLPAAWRYQNPQLNPQLCLGLALFAAVQTK